MRFTYSDQQLQFLRTEFPKLSKEALTEKFNKKFKMNKTVKQILCTLKNHGFTCGRSPGELNKGSKIYTPEIRKVIEQEYVRHTRAEVAEILNKKFNTKFTAEHIASYCKRMKINSGKTGHFPKGNTSWNQGTKGVMKPNSGSFSLGDIPPNRKPFGHERICLKDDYVLVKIDRINPFTGRRGHYVHKHRHVWELAHGAIPEDKIVNFVDGNKRNFAIENLELIDRATLAQFNKNQLQSAPAEIKPTLRTLLKLEVATARLSK